MPPPAVSAQPRRHPDFAKDTQPTYPPYQHRPQMYRKYHNFTSYFTLCFCILSSLYNYFRQFYEEIYY